MNVQPTEHDLHAYVDGRLDDERIGMVRLWLRQHPERAAQLEAWRRDAQSLRAALAGQESPVENPALDPARLRQALRRARHRRWSVAAMLLLALGVGGAGGWMARSIGRAAAPMQDAMAAYRLLALERSMRPDLLQRQDGELQAWLDQHFAHAERLPDLAAKGFHPAAGRLLSTDQGQAAMVVYLDAQGRAISFYIRPPGPQHHLLSPGRRRDGGLVAEYWSDRGYNYAVVAIDNGDGARLLPTARARAG